MNNRIAIISNADSLDLYQQSRSFYENLPYDKFPVVHSHAFDFLNHVITDAAFADIDTMVYIDEDCFITDTEALSSLIDFSLESKFSGIGMPDGGVVKIRSHSPIAINQFFCILDLFEIRKKYKLEEVLETKHGSDLEKFTPTDLLKYQFTYDNYESYYKIFLWMLRNDMPFMYLDAYQYDVDGTTTILKNHEGKDFAYHTWYGRNWNDPFHRTRIQSVIDHCLKIKNCQ